MALETPAGVDLDGEGTTVGPGESETLSGTIACDRLDGDLTASVELSGEGVDITQSVDLGPICQSESD